MTSSHLHRLQAACRRLVLLMTALTVTALEGCRSDVPGANDRMALHDDSQTGQSVVFDVNLKSYVERPIFDVYLNGIDIGVAGGAPHFGSGGLMTGVSVRLGPQVVTWRLDGPKGMPGNGDTVRAVNQPILVKPDPTLRYLGVHIYPDSTVELIPEAVWPERTARGEAFLRAAARTDRP